MAGESYENENFVEGEISPRNKRRHDNDDESASRDTKRVAHGKDTPLIKVLIPNDAAGAIIGKGGSNLGDLKTRYGASIRISHSRDVYPDTDERIVVLTGEVGQIIDLHNYIIDKVADARGTNSRSRDDVRGQQVKMIVTNNVAGLIIGKGGAIIKALKEETGAYIDVTGLHQSPVSGERILTIRGNTEQRIEAARQVISKIASDPGNMANTSLKYSHTSRETNNTHDYQSRGADHMLNRNQNAGGLQSMPLGPQLGAGAINSLGNLAEVAQQLVGLSQGQSQTSSSSLDGIKTTVQIQMEIPELLVAPIVGIQGNTLKEFIQFSGARIDFSRSEVSISHRLLTIHGDLNQTQIAYHLINQKITQIRNELAASGL